MKVIVIKQILILFAVFSLLEESYAQVIFQKEYSSGIHVPFMTDTLSDGFLIAGSTATNTLGGMDGFVMKTDTAGNTIWAKNFGGTEDDQFFSMYQMSNGHFVLAGKTKSFVNDISDLSNVFLVEMDTAGNLIRSKSIGSLYTDIAYSIKQTNDNGFVIAGSSDSLGIIQPIVVKTDNLFNIEWSQKYSNAAFDVSIIKSIIQTNDGGYAFTGYATLTSAAIDTNLFIVKTNSLGVPAFSNHYFFNDIANYTERGAYAYDIIQNDQGNLVIVGATGGLYQSIFRPYTPLVMSCDLSGNLLSSKIIYLNSGDSRATSIQQTTDGGYIIGGSLGNYFMTMIKLPNLTEIEWSYHYSNNFNPPSKGFQVCETKDNGYIFVGSLVSGEAIRLVKTNETGISGCDQGVPSMQTINDIVLSSQSINWTSADNLDTTVCNSSILSASLNTNVICFNALSELNEFDKMSTIEIFPNPADEILHIQLIHEKMQQLIITDIFGSVKYEQSIQNEEEISIDISSFPSGIYFVNIENENIKFIKE